MHGNDFGRCLNLEQHVLALSSTPELDIALSSTPELDNADSFN